MSAIDELFRKLNKEQRVAFMPFVTAGDPNLEFTADLLTALDSAGCHLVELGFPYSDPIADGPVIQESYTRALKNHVRVHEILEMVQRVSPSLSLPLVAMVSYAIIFRHGIESFLDQSKASGISEVLRDLCDQRDLSLVPLITPTTAPDRVAHILETARGFIYYVSIAGITGERSELPAELADNLRELRRQTETPICVGFGISHPKQAAMLTEVADGVIVGSAIVRRIGELALSHRDSAIQSVVDFSKEMLSGLKKPEA